MRPGEKGGIVLETEEELTYTAEALLNFDPKYAEFAGNLTRPAELPHTISTEEANLVMEGLSRIINDIGSPSGWRSLSIGLLSKYRENMEFSKKLEVLDRIVDAGWNHVGGDTLVEGKITSTDINLIRKEGGSELSPEDAIRHLKLTGSEEGTLLLGFEVALDEDTKELYIDYSGPDDERFKQFLEDAISWGKELNEEQAKIEGINRLH